MRTYLVISCATSSVKPRHAIIDLGLTGKYNDRHMIPRHSIVDLGLTRDCQRNLGSSSLLFLPHVFLNTVRIHTSGKILAEIRCKCDFSW